MASTARFVPLVLALALVGCNPLARFSKTSISTVTQNPANHQDVTVRGKVINQIGIFGQGAYQIQDESGSVWVLTQSGIPQINTSVTVRGKASEGIALGGRNLGVTITEAERF